MTVKRKKGHAWRVMKRIGYAVLVLIAVRLIFYFVGVNRLNVNERYAKAAKEYLETTHNEKFEVVEQWHDTRETGPIPHFDFPSICYYVAYPESDPDYPVIVYISKSKYSYKIEKIEDTYYGKVLRKQLLNYVIDNLSDKLGEMKVYMTGEDNRMGFSGFTINSTLEDFFKIDKTFSFPIAVYIPMPIKETSKEELEEILMTFASEWKESEAFSDNTSISIRCLKNRSDYELLETEGDENPLYNNRRIIKVWEDPYYWQHAFEYDVEAVISLDDVR